MQVQKKNTYTEEQLAFINADVKSNIILRATAGSGKTFCAVERVRFLLSNGVDPSKILFFSYTKAAVEEFRARLQNDAIKITTIHAFCQSMLSKMKKYKDVVDIYEFINWYKEKHKPKSGSPSQVIREFYQRVTDMYENAHFIGSEITAYKLQIASDIKCRKPELMDQYYKFTKETKTRDFSDMLIEVRDLLKENRWLLMFRNKYDYILVDEFQDTSSIQMEILLKLNAKYYTLIGDIGQSIFGYSGANATEVMESLKKRREVSEMTLSVNFRSAKTIVENSNNYSTLKAIPSKSEEGQVHRKILVFNKFLEMVNEYDEIVLLCRTNGTIRDIEREMLKKKFPINYKNFFSQTEIDLIKENKETISTRDKVSSVISEFGSKEALLQFIESNRSSKKHLTTIHKSKGLEYDTCVVVNCFAPDILDYNNITELSDEQKKKFSFDPDDDEDFEARNVFYVAITRPKNSLFFMAYKI
jgi:DNA helicase-2/ATP-dependent DNA helicase PcrA